MIEINVEDETIVEAKGVSVVFGNNVVLSDVCFNMKKGELLYLIGKTGAGKTSFLRLLFADVKLHSGSLNVVGYNIGRLKKRQIQSLRRKLGIVFQDFQLLTDRTIYENFFFVMRATGWADKKQMMQRADEVLSMVDLYNKGNFLPYQLSGGEQQRVAIARALINNPLLILADEPTGNLDLQTAFEIMKILMEMNKKGIAVLIATHNYNLIEKYPYKTYLCENQKIKEL